MASLATQSLKFISIPRTKYPSKVNVIFRIFKVTECPASITNQGYACSAVGCEVVYTDGDGEWGVENNEWCGCGKAPAPKPKSFKYSLVFSNSFFFKSHNLYRFSCHISFLVKVYNCFFFFFFFFFDENLSNLSAKIFTFLFFIPCITSIT